MWLKIHLMSWGRTEIVYRFIQFRIANANVCNDKWECFFLLLMRKVVVVMYKCGSHGICIHVCMWVCIAWWCVAMAMTLNHHHHPFASTCVRHAFSLVHDQSSPFP